MDELKIPLIPLPRAAGVPKPKRVRRYRKTRGRDLTEIVTDHLHQFGTDEIAWTKPWASQMGVNRDGNRILINKAYNEPGVFPVLGPVPLRKSDKDEPGQSRKRVHLDSGEPVVTLTQDAIEEFQEDCLDENCINWD